MIVRVDFDKCTLMLRSLKLESFAEGVLGWRTAAVYGAVLRSMEDTARFKKEQDGPKPVTKAGDSDDEDEDEFPTVPDMKVLEQLGESFDLFGGITRQDPNKALINQ